MGDIQRKAFASRPRDPNRLRRYLNDRSAEFSGLDPWQRFEWRANLTTGAGIALILLGSVVLLGADLATHLITGHGIR